jgi:DNA-binding beta-propeller fold protein YncE
MKLLLRPLFSGLIAVSSLALLPTATAHAAGGYRVTNSFKLGGKGSWDYLIVDEKQKLLFVPRNTHVMVVNELTGKTVADITGMKHSHGVALVPSAGRGFVSDGEDGSVYIFDLKTYAVLGSVKVAEDADGIIYDEASNKVICVSGDAGLATTFSPDIDPSSGKADQPIPLGGKPEYLAADGQGRVFVNITDKAQVAVIDTKTMAVTDRWSTAPGGEPVAMAIDRENHRLVLGCRKPARMIVMSTADGKVISAVRTGEGADAAQVDGDKAFVSCRDGSLTVAQADADGKFKAVQHLKTNIWAGTMGVDTQTHTLYFPTGDFAPHSDWKKRPAALPDSFKILVVKEE